MKKFKKIQSALLAAGILATALPVYSAAAVGDLNGDGFANKTDVEMFAQYFAGWPMEEAAKEKMLAAGDVNGDEVVTRADAMELARSVEGWSGYTPMEEKIYTQELDESHIQTTILENDGEKYEQSYIDNELIVIAEENTERNYIEQLVSQHDGTIVGQIPVVNFYQIEFDDIMTAEELQAIADILIADTSVKDAYLNSVFEMESSAYYPNDRFNDNSHSIWDSEYKSNRTWSFIQTHVPEAWELVKSVNPSPSINIGVYDGLFDETHEDLNLEVVYYQKKSFTYNKHPNAAYHGTHVAGIIGATMNNDIGVTGVALNPTLFAATAASGESVKEDGTLSPILYVSFATHAAALTKLIKENKCKIVNISLGYQNVTNSSGEETGPVYNKSYEEDSLNLEKDILVELIKQEYDFLIFNAAGNSGHLSHNTQYSSIFTYMNNPIVKNRIVIVGNAAFKHSELPARAKDSSYVGGKVEIMAPGNPIYSTIPPKADYNYFFYDDELPAVSGYDYTTGTSMASPFAAGVAALVWEANPHLSPEMVKEIICDKENTTEVTDSDVGMVNAEAAVKKAISLKPVSGHIISKEANEAISDATVTLFNETSTETAIFTSDDRGYVKGFTDSEQIFTKAKITADGFEETIVDVYYYINNNYSLGEIKLPALIKTYTLSGKVTDGTNALPDVTVTLTDVSDSDTIFTPVITDKNGAYYFTIPNGTYSLTFTHTEYGEQSVENKTIENGNKSLDDVVLFLKGSVIASGTISSNLTWNLKGDGTLTISGQGKAPSYSSSTGNTRTQPWMDYRTLIKKVVVEYGITSLGKYLFADLSNLVDVILPESVTDLGFGTFAGCKSLRKISLPDSIKTIGWDAFYSCMELEEVKLPRYLSELDTHTFYNCDSLINISLPSSIKRIPSNCFNDCNNLLGIYFNGNAPSLGSDCFLNTPTELTFYYISGKSGWTSPTWNAPDGKVYNTATWEP